MRATLSRISFSLILVACFLSGCATVPGEPNARDPYQSFNRAMYQFNDTLDHAVLKPAAKGYQAVAPNIFKTAVRNFFSNLHEIVVVANDLLQGKFSQGGQDTVRFAVNSTVGLAGLIDVATPMGLEKHEQDLGLTFARWGAESGPYLVLPFFGPSSVRDAFGRVGDSAFSPYVFATNLSTTSKVELFALDAVSRREKLLSDETLLDDVALSADHYNMIRDAWLQRRQNLVYEGHPPKDDEDEDDPDDAPSAR